MCIINDKRIIDKRPDAVKKITAAGREIDRLLNINDEGIRPMSFNYRSDARRKAAGVSERDSKAMDQAFGYTPKDIEKTSPRYYDITVEEFAKRFKGVILAEVKKVSTIPCLSPDEMRCESCGHNEPDEIDWDYHSETGRIFCINCIE